MSPVGMGHENENTERFHGGGNTTNYMYSTCTLRPN